ncbi:hypothetical protein [Rhodococcus sp. ANT_H53B]|uniref:hypothetical protein n=1 Tax=Rhodococcus sp. ANT_H53B TaxID=2597357 RepID=UPI0011EE2D47|nr:hypothetical protein [Rhodococcus sp. ANT_H53B]KAA0925953.1 hypothetical protein FQ188_10385 [Rhodococcus sp. ANT_H53B]
MAGTTTNFSLPYPTSGDPIYQGAQQIKDAMDAVDVALTGVGVPVPVYKLKARNVRTTTKTTTATTSGTAAGIMTTSCEVTAGRAYRIIFTCAFSSSVSNTTGQIDFRYTTNGASPTAGSTLLEDAIFSNGSSATIPLTQTKTFYYYPATSHTLTIGAFVFNAVGGGTLTVQSSGATRPGVLTVEDMGGSISTTGAIL